MGLLYKTLESCSRAMYLYFPPIPKHSPYKRCSVTVLLDEADEEKIEGILKKSGLDKLVKTCYDLLGLMSFLTAGPKEVRAWTIEKGTKAPQAAGKIHTDFERGFIRAEVVSFQDLVEQGSMNACKEKGLIRSEGKDYVMRDGDVVVFRFNV